MYDILYYNNLNHVGLEAKFNKIVSFLKNGDFKSAEVKKLTKSSYLRAKLDDSNRLLFTPLTYQNKTYLVVLEVIRNHEYEKSRFLRGVTTIDETDVPFLEHETIESNSIQHKFDIMSTLAVSPQNRPVHFLDKFLVFDDDQSPVINCALPLILIGSAGSGKTSLMLEKLKTLSGNVLYISLSSYLVHNTHQLYYSKHYENDKQEVDFLSFHEFLETIKIPNGREVTVRDFLGWFNRQTKPKFLQDGRKLFEEFRGVLTGCSTKTAYLTHEEYINLGIKQSVYSDEERTEVHKLFMKYLSFLNDSNLYDSNLIAFEYAPIATKKYDAVLIDEIQDFTNTQLALILKTLNNVDKFFLCGDANQIVHPNFFSWSKLKSYFYVSNDIQSNEITRILAKNYRNTPEVVELANRVLKLKNYKFGSIDKESHVLIQSTINSHGTVNCIDAHSNLVKELNTKTAKSIKYAVLVLYENDKARARELLNTPLIFTPQEAKGLEYENVILFDFISNEPKFAEIAKGVDNNYLNTDFTYARTKEKSDKSLEIYKFYINALYVVITRATKNIYLIEKNPSHKFLQLLNINEIKQIEITEDKSSLEDWAIEANKLAKQGKIEQMQAIEEQILQYKKLPWQIITKKEYAGLKKSVANDITKINKKDIIRILNYAVLYHDTEIIEKFVQANIKIAQNMKKVQECLIGEYFSDYVYNNTKQMFNKINQFGVNFRNQFNFTPLMCASYMLNYGHISELIKHNPSMYEIDNRNRNAFMIMLSRVYSHINIKPEQINKIYEILCPSNISIQVDGKLIKIDAHKIEFLLCVSMLIILQEVIILNKNVLHVFTCNVILERFFSRLSGSYMLPTFRVKRSYVNAVLARNEINSKYPYNRKIFKRVRMGQYILNPDLKIKVSDAWYSVNQFIDIHH